jgi:hypothetical protein
VDGGMAWGVAAVPRQRLTFADLGILSMYVQQYHPITNDNIIILL